MLETIKSLLQNIIKNIDAGNSNISESDAFEIIKIIRTYTDKTQRLSKYQACQYLNISRATFDNMVREGKIPRGKKIAGFKELSWEVKDLDNIIKSSKNGHKKNNNNTNI